MIRGLLERVSDKDLVALMTTGDCLRVRFSRLTFYFAIMIGESTVAMLRIAIRSGYGSNKSSTTMDGMHAGADGGGRGWAVGGGRTVVRPPEFMNCHCMKSIG